jgi:hypothetical protein
MAPNFRAGFFNASVRVFLICVFFLPKPSLAKPPQPVPADQNPNIIGVVVVSQNATLDGQPALPSQIVFSGEKLKVNDGAVEVMLKQGGRLAFGTNTEAVLMRVGNETSTGIQRGNLRLWHAEHGSPLLVTLQDISVRPDAVLSTDAEISVSDDFVSVATHLGSVRVEGKGHDVKVARAEAVRFRVLQDSSQEPEKNESDKGVSGHQPPAPGGAGIRNLDWECLAFCALPGAAVAGVVIAIDIGSGGSQVTPTSPAPDWLWALVPVGVATGELVCYKRHSCSQ